MAFKKNDPFAKAAGSKGGQATKDKYGTEYFSQIGKKGGAALMRERGSEFFSQISRSKKKVTKVMGND